MIAGFRGCRPVILPAIQTETLDLADKLVKLSRYEAHLDRKFERTLAMLLKL